MLTLLLTGVREFRRYKLIGVFLLPSRVRATETSILALNRVHYALFCSLGEELSKGILILRGYQAVGCGSVSARPS